MTWLKAPRIFQWHKADIYKLYELDLLATWCHFYCTLLVEAVTIPPQFRGEDIDPTSQWRECQRIYGHVLKLSEKI